MDDPQSDGGGDGRQAPDGLVPVVSWDLPVGNDLGHDAATIVDHTPGPDATDGPLIEELADEMVRLVHGERRKTRESSTAEVIARAHRAVARARETWERTAALLARLEATWGISPGCPGETVANRHSGEPIASMTVSASFRR
jgi:hypothetical protein